MTLLEEPEHGIQDDQVQALIKEARRRMRRRRALVGLGVIVVAALAAIGVPVFHQLSSTRSVGPKTTTEPRPPAVDRAAIRGHGRLAFVSKGTLWVLDGSTGSLRAVLSSGLVPSDPTFSVDGRWLAYVASKEQVYDSGGYRSTTVVWSDLWMARSNGTDAHVVGNTLLANLAGGSAVGWSPRSDEFAIAVGKTTRAPFDVATGVDLVNPSGQVQVLVGGSNVIGAAWAPNGASVAVSTETGPSGSDPWSATLAVYPVDGGPVVTWERLQQQYLALTGWWPHWGIGYTTVGAGGVPGGSATVDGSPFFTISAPGAAPLAMGTILSDGSAGLPSVSATGWMAVPQESVDGGGRTIWQGKGIAVCSPATNRCSQVPHANATVAVDPIWVPGGTTLGYAEAPEYDEAPYTQQTTSTWYDAHQLRLFQPTSGVTTTVSQLSGASVPVWAQDGQSVIYVSGNGLWLGSSGSDHSSPQEIAHPLFTPNQWPAFYGQVPFAQQFAWSAGTRSLEPAGT